MAAPSMQRGRFIVVVDMPLSPSQTSSQVDAAQDIERCGIGPVYIFEC